ncbi:hypothetical protein [Pseudomonas juntendi]|uniref:hypothetical protein n=1 Tax=Pseudomonas juntendi TaxID=2666183 RepID=UPI0032083D3A
MLLSESLIFNAVTVFVHTVATKVAVQKQAKRELALGLGYWCCRFNHHQSCIDHFLLGSTLCLDSDQQSGDCYV